MSSLFFKSSRAFRRDQGRLDGGGLALVRTPTIFKRALSTSDPIKPCRPPSTAHKPAVVSTLLKRAASTNSLVREERSYVKEILQQNGYPERFLSPQCSPSRKDREEKDDPRSHVTIPYIQAQYQKLKFTRATDIVYTTLHTWKCL